MSNYYNDNLKDLIDDYQRMKQALATIYAEVATLEEAIEVAKRALEYIGASLDNPEYQRGSDEIL